MLGSREARRALSHRLARDGCSVAALNAIGGHLERQYRDEQAKLVGTFVNVLTGKTPSTWQEVAEDALRAAAHHNGRKPKVGKPEPGGHDNGQAIRGQNMDAQEVRDAAERGISVPALRGWKWRRMVADDLRSGWTEDEVMAMHRIPRDQLVAIAKEFEVERPKRKRTRTKKNTHPKEATK